MKRIVNKLLPVLMALALAIALGSLYRAEAAPQDVKN